MSQPPPIPWESAFLAGIAAAWAKRRKAIGHQARIAGAERFGPSNDDSDERFVLAFAKGAHQHVTVTIRATRRVQVVAAERVPNDGWAWTFSDAGRLSADGPALIAAIEQTLSACYGMTAERTAEFTAIWRPLLAKGPRAVD